MVSNEHVQLSLRSVFSNHFTSLNVVPSTPGDEVGTVIVDNGDLVPSSELSPSTVQSSRNSSPPDLNMVLK